MPAASYGAVAQAAPSNQATVVAQLPADAKLYVEGQEVKGASGSRRFVSPQLQPGKDYYYTVKAEAVRDGRTVSQTREIVVRAGQTARVALSELRGAGDAPARVTVQLPEDARLYVDGVRCPLTSGTRSWQTAALRADKDYTYTLKAEVVRNGRTVADTREVVLRAGKAVSVNFAALGTALDTAKR